MTRHGPSSLGQRRDGHGLVVQPTAPIRGERTEFAVRIEAREGGRVPEHVPDGLDLLLGPLLQDQLATHAADEQGHVGRMPRLEAAAAAAPVAPSISRSKFAFISRARAPTGMSPANVMDWAGSSMPRIVRTVDWPPCSHAR